MTPMIKGVRQFYGRVENKVVRLRMGPERVLEARGDYDGALGLWVERVSDDPTDLDAVLGQLRALRHLDRQPEAQAVLGDILDTHGWTSDLRRQEAKSAADREEWAEALNHWTELRRSVTADSEATAGIADAQFALGMVDEAEAEYRRLVSEGHLADRGHVGIARIAERRGDLQSAIEIWAKLETGEAQAAQARILLRQGKPDDAIQILEDGLQTHPGNQSIYSQLNQICQATCDFERWERHLTVQISANRKNTFLRTQRALAANNLGDVFTYWRDLDFAEERYRREAWNGDIRGLADLSAVLLRKGELDQTRDLLPSMVDVCVSRPQAPLLRATTNSLLWLGDVEGLRSVVSAIDGSTLSGAPLAELANMHRVLENDVDAAECCDRMVAEGDVSRRGAELRSWACGFRGDWAQARRHIEELCYPATMNYYRALDGRPLGGLTNLDPPPSSSDFDGSVVAMSVCRDEIGRLPQWLDHYRSLGVDHFLMVDNGSVDGTTEYLRAQADITTFAAAGYYRHTASGRRWLNQLIDQYCENSWCLIADVDEFLVFPHVEQGIKGLSQHLESQGAESMFAVMLDMHGERLDAWRMKSDDTRMLDVFPYFDSRTTLVGSRHAPYLSVAGGMRNFVLPKVMPESLLSKPAMIRGGRGIRHLTSHTTTPCASAQVTGAFLHFKFAVDPKPRSEYSSSKGVFARLLASDLATTRERELVSEWSVRYTGVEQLIEHALIRTSEAFDATV